MRISVEDGIVVCAYDTRFKLSYSEREYLRDTAGLWKPICKGKLKLNYTPNTAADELERAKEENTILWKVAPSLDNLNVHRDDTFEAKLNELHALLEPERKRKEAERQAELKKQYQREKWESLCKNGCNSCGRCEHIRIDGDDFRCAASGDLLDDKNVRKYINGIHYLFNYEPFPNGNCVYKIN